MIQTKDLKTFQLKAARRALDIPLRTVSKETGVGVNAIWKLEACDLGSAPKKSQIKTITHLRLFFESQGIEFLENGGLRYVPEQTNGIVFRIKK
jgi:hypothetical protein